MSSVAARPTKAYGSPGDNAAEQAARMFVEHSEQILRYCLRRRRSRQEAEDAVQTTFLYAVRALRRGVVPECEPAWLHAIAKNVCLSQNRSAVRRGPVASDVDLDLLPSPPRDDEAELLVELQDALRSIPERQRYALVLREWQGLAPREIAVQLGLSGPATNALLTRARHALARALAAPRSATPGLVSLVYELRLHLKALLGTASAKAAVAAVAVVGAGVGGYAAERALENEPTAPATAVRAAVERDAVAVDPSATPTVSRVPGRAPARVVRTGVSGGSRSRPSTTSARVPLVEPTSPGPTLGPFAPTPAGDPAPAPGPRPEAPGAPAPELPPLPLPVDPPTLPAADVPTGVLPPVELPPVELPPVEPPLDVGLPPLPLP